MPVTLLPESNGSHYFYGVEKMMTFKKKRPRKIGKSSKASYLAITLCCLFVAGATYVLILSNPVQSNAVPTSSVKIVNDFDTVLLPTPVRAVARGERLDRVGFARTKWPLDRVSENYVKKLSDLKGAVSTMPLPAHLPVPTSAITFSRGEANAVVEGIPQGYRAITVRVDAESAVEGWARSGSYVDVILLRRSAKRSKGMEAKIVAENVKILSAGRSTAPLTGQDAAPKAPATVTLLVNQEDALKIKTAASVGKLTFSLRGLGDASPTKAVSMNQEKLLGSSRTFVPKKEHYRGSAMGPDGRKYVLKDDMGWIRAPNKRLLSNSVGMSVSKKGQEDDSAGDTKGAKDGQ